MPTPARKATTKTPDIVPPTMAPTLTPWEAGSAVAVGDIVDMVGVAGVADVAKFADGDADDDDDVDVNVDVEAELDVSRTAQSSTLK